MPRDSVSCYVKAKNDIRIEMMDESYLIALPVGGHRGFRFDKIFFQEGIDIGGFNCILACSWSAIGSPIMVNDNYEIVELPEEFQQFKKHRCVEDRSNKTIKTMTGYDYIEAVSDKQEVCNEINRLDRLRKILENRLEEELGC